MADNVPNIGHVPADNAARDAIHFAVMPIEAGNALLPGARVGLLYDGRAGNVADNRTIGIVDPFLRDPVPVGSRFWLLLDPGTITELRHEWTHPAFARPGDERTLSEAWLRKFCEGVGERYEYVMEGARTFVRATRHGDWPAYLYGERDSGALEGVFVPDEFWTHYDIVTGESTAPEERQSFFTCSC